MTTERSTALKGMAIRPLAELVDDVMAGVPARSLDLADPEMRSRLRDWLMHLAEQITRHNVDHFSDAASRTIREMGELLVDPDLYETRRKFKAQRAKDREERREWERQAQERAANVPPKQRPIAAPAQKERK